ncbi:transposase [Candidatus Magnetomorum sp. HK-1]|nr:transposase [Candidatus Magnetomorum sp. HK-1]
MNKNEFKTTEIVPSLSNAQIDDISLAASKMHGHEKRTFMAEMTLKYCDGKSRRAESIF